MFLISVITTKVDGTANVGDRRLLITKSMYFVL